MKKHGKTLTDSSKRRLIEQDMNMVAGLDLGDKHSHVCLIDLDGRAVESKKIRTTAPALEKYFSAWAATRSLPRARRSSTAYAARCRVSATACPPPAAFVSAVRAIHSGSSRAGLGAAALGFAATCRGGKSAKRKAIVALARQLAVLPHVLWKRDIDFDPFYGTAARQAA